MHFNIHENISITELRNRLGWWNHSGGEISELVSVCMILCDKIAALESENERLQEVAQEGLCPHGSKRIDCLHCDRIEDMNYDAMRERGR